MAVSSGAPARELFQRWRAGDAAALQQLLPLVYDELRRIARAHLRRERADHTLQTTALVHEAYLRLMQQRPHEADDRCQFVAMSSRLMRQVLVDHARARLAAKRHGGYRVTLSEDVAVCDREELDVIAVDEALQRLAQLDHQQAYIVELRYFGGLSIPETAEALGVSEVTVKRDWAAARAWLHREMLGASG